MKIQYSYAECFKGCNNPYCPYMHNEGFECFDDNGNSLGLGLFSTKEEAENKYKKVEMGVDKLNRTY